VGAIAFLMRVMVLRNPVMVFIRDGERGKKMRTFVQSSNPISPLFLFFFRVLNTLAL
jgi:hypothetical protein